MPVILKKIIECIAFVEFLKPPTAILFLIFLYCQSVNAVYLYEFNVIYIH